MNFILNALGNIFGKLLGSSKQKTNNKTVKFSTQDNTAIADATAAILWICAACLAIYWIPQYLFADYMWFKMCVAHNAMMPFPLKDQKLFDLIYSLLGLGGVGIAHLGTKILTRMLK